MNKPTLEKVFKIIEDHEKRIVALEKDKSSNLTGVKVQDESKGEIKEYSGPTGGIRFLISKGFFKKKMGFATIREEVAANDYHYSRQAIYEALKRLSKSGGPLVNLGENNKKVYVKRK